MPTKMITLPSQARLLELFTYDPATGLLRRKISPANGFNIGDIVGHKAPKGVYVGVDRKVYKAHRLIWKMVTGRDPTDQIDHRNINSHDNRWNNLREATASDNTANRRRWRKHSIGLKGVSTNGNHFKARIQVKKRRIDLGTFKSAEEAHTAYIAAAKHYFKHFSNSG